MATLRKLSAHCRAETENNIRAVAAQFGLTLPPTSPADTGLDRANVHFMTELVVATGSSLPDFVRLVRGQTAADSRPNKDLYALPRSPNPELQGTFEHWNEVVAHGVIPEWLPQGLLRQQGRPRNYNSIFQHLPQVWRHIRKGQDDRRYIVVHASMLSQWPEVFLSPVGIVDKEGPDGPDIRVIDDYSFPEGSSINDFTDRSNLPDIRYNPPSDIAKRIANLHRAYPDKRILLMLGDVAGAFRHVPIHADHTHMFAFIIDDTLVIDLYCGFGWCGSPAWYFVPGSLINGLYEQGLPDTMLNPPLTGSFWCDDHTCVEVDDGPRCFIAALALRRAMATILGPTAINERKFTEWSERGRALGLIWNTQRSEVTIPVEKIVKAQERVRSILAASAATRTALLQLLGSLRHVLTCCPPSRSFFNESKTW